MDFTDPFSDLKGKPRGTRECRILIGVMVAMLGSFAPALGKFGISKTRAVSLMHYPPAFHTPGREVRVRFSSDFFGPDAALAGEMQQQVEEALLREGFRISPAALTVLQGSLDEARAAVERERRPVNLEIHIGEHTEKDKNGKEKQVEDCKRQQVNAVFLVSRGRLALDLVAVDTRTAATTFRHRFERQYDQESMVDGPRLCGKRTYAISPGHLRYRREILAHLAGQVVAETVRLASGYGEDRSILLAVDDELKPGNALALAGNWPQALAAWERISIPSSEKETEAARHYNLGVAHEVLAAAAMRNGQLDEAGARLTDAEKFYALAITLDSKEKYFRDTHERVQHSRAVLDKMLHYRTLNGGTDDDLIPVSPDGFAKSAEIPLEGWPENEQAAVHDFRVYVRTRLEARIEAPDESFRQKLISTAADYGVGESPAAGVVDSETQRLRVLIRNMEKYQEDFRDVAADGAVSAAEREMLRKRQKTLHLSDAQVRAVEARFPSR
jgi:hypothetical protein